MAEIEITVGGKHLSEKELFLALKNSGSFIKDAFKPKSKYVYRYLDKSMRNILRGTVRRRFATQTDPSGKKWKELSKYRTWQKKARGTFGKGTLRDTDKLKKSIVVEKPKISNDTATIEQITKCPYAWVHQPTAGRPRGKIATDNSGYVGLILTNWKDHAGLEGHDDIEFESKVSGKMVRLTREGIFPEVFIPTRAFLGFDKESYDQMPRAENKMVKEVVKDFFKYLEYKLK